MAPRSLRTLALFAAAPLAAALALSGCGSSSDGGDSAKANSSAPLYKDLPSNIQKAGTIQIGSSVDYPPFEYYAEDGKTLKGFEVELANKLEKELGVTFTWNNASFDTLLPALASNRYDIVYGATNDTAEREKDYDFVYYLQSSQGFVVAAGNPSGIKTESDLCGKSVAAVRGGIQVDVLGAISDNCVKSGAKKLNILTFDGNAQEQLAVRQGRADALIENFPTAAAFASESDGKLELVPGLQAQRQFFGMVLPKSSTQLRDALVKAWQGIIDDGSYGEILKKWNLDDIAVKKAGVNAVASGAKA